MAMNAEYIQISKEEYQKLTEQKHRFTRTEELIRLKEDELKEVYTECISTADSVKQLDRMVRKLKYELKVIRRQMCSHPPYRRIIGTNILTHIVHKRTKRY